eukprot:2083724-Pleurochrysis_carterae.AAC.3
MPARVDVSRLIPPSYTFPQVPCTVQQDFLREVRACGPICLRPCGFPAIHPLHTSLARTLCARAPLKIRTCGLQGRLEHAFHHPVQPTAPPNPRACARAALRPDMHFACASEPSEPFWRMRTLVACDCALASVSPGLHYLHTPSLHPSRPKIPCYRTRTCNNGAIHRQFCDFPVCPPP